MNYIGPDETIPVSCTHEGCDGYGEFPYSLVLELYRDQLYIKLHDCDHVVAINEQQLQVAKAQVNASMRAWRKDSFLMKRFRELRDVRLQGQLD